MVACGQKAEEPQVPAAEQASSTEVEAAASESGSPRSAQEGGPRNWVVRSDGVNLRGQPSLSAPVLTTFMVGTVLDNLGCSTAEGRDWCDVQPLGGGPRGFVAAELLQPAKAAEGDFNATGTISCAMAPGRPLGNCPFSVERAEGGTAKVVVTRPDGSKLTLYFHMGKAIAADSSEAGGGGPFSARKVQQLYTIQVGDERYQVEEAVVFGS